MRRACAIAVLWMSVACGRTELVDYPSERPDAGLRDAGVVDAGGVDAGACGIPLDATVTATLSVTADNQREVWVNGALVEATANEWFQATRLTVTLARHPARENVVAVRATNLSSQAGLDRGLLLDVRLNDAVVVSDAAWRQTGVTDGGWNPADPSWLQPGFDDSRWGRPVEQAGNGARPWGQVPLVHPLARWIWPYRSDVFPKPNLEPVLFRRSLYVTVDGGLADQPSPCP